MVTLYGIPNCNTVKKARTWLEEKGIDYQFHDYKKQGVESRTIETWLEQLPWERLVNRAGMTFRKLTDEEKAAIKDKESATKLMLEKTSVIKRPIVEKEGAIVAVGFKVEEYETLFG